MKPSHEWDEQDLLQLIAVKVQESIALDYKACDSLKRDDENSKNNVSKDVSAFANSAGGTIVYGMREDVTKTFPSGLDAGYDQSLAKPITKEWLENIITSRIQRRIDGVIINPVRLTNGNLVYVVYVPQSNRAAHMASDKKFYKRHNFKSEPMEEYEVRDVSRRADTPDLELLLSVNKPATPLV
jgi:predicted HTH transcriptional regulator